MTRRLRVLFLMATLALALVAAADVGLAQPLVRQMPPPCAPGQMPSMETPCMPSGSGGQQPQPCPAGVQPTPEAPCMPAGGGQGAPPACAPGQTPTPQAPCMSGSPGGGQPGGGSFDWGSLPDCAVGVQPTPEAPCRFAMPDCADGQMPSAQSPCRPKPCPPGVRPSRTAPCIPDGQDGGFEAPPTGQIGKELKSKFMVINIKVEGSGDANGSFDVIFRSVEDGVSQQTAAYLNEQLKGESFVIGTDASTRCFADTSDPDKIPDLVPCKELDDAADNAPGSIRAQFRGKVSFDQATFSPVFKAQKIVFLRGVFDVAKIGG